MIFDEKREEDLFNGFDDSNLFEIEKPVTESVSSLPITTVNLGKFNFYFSNLLTKNFPESGPNVNIV